MLISSWCFIIFCLNIVHISKQDVGQPTNQDLMKAILKLDSRLDQLDATLDNVKANFAIITGKISSIESEIEDIGGRTSLTLVASRKTLNELNVLKYNISNDGKLIHEQTLNELSVMKHNLSEDGKLFQEQTVSEFNAMKNNISGELLSLNVKVAIFEENLSEKLNETSESMKDPLNIMRTTLLSLENNVDQIQKSQSNTSVSLQNIEGDTEYMIQKTVEERCSVADGFFSTPGGNQCMKAYRDQGRTWSDAKSFCLAQGLILAKPVDAVFIQKYLQEKHGDNTFYWVSARGTGGAYKWMQGDTLLHSSSTLWGSGNPNYGGSSSYCVWLTTYKHRFGTPYSDDYCSSKNYPLCERVMG